MGIPTNIKTLLTGNVVEWARIEYKETWDAAASLKTICAFANDLDNWGGGYVVIGVQEENGQPVRPLAGVASDKIDAYQKDILQTCKLIVPAYMPIIEVATYQEKQFIVLWCPGGDTRPYASPKTMGKDNKEKAHYIRKGSSTILPSAEEERDLYQLANKVPFDDRINHAAELTDLNITLIRSYLKEVGSSLFDRLETDDFLAVCRDMNIVSYLPEYAKPKNVGLLFFSLEPEKFFPCTQIDVVQFPEGLGGDHIVEQTFKGPLHQQLRDALRFIRNNIITEKVVKHPDKAEADRFFNYPYQAIEEALSNAVYHRAYDEREPIEVRVERDRIEIVSFPGPDRSITLEGLKQYRVSNRRYRNRRVGDFLKELHLTEGRNTGFKKILDALENNGSPKPEFETDADRSYFIARIFARPEFLADDIGGENETIDPKATLKSHPKKGGETSVISEKVTLKSHPKTTLKNHSKTTAEDQALQLQILQLLSETSTISKKELEKRLGITEHQLRKQIDALKQAKRIVHHGAKRGGHWVILPQSPNEAL